MQTGLILSGIAALSLSLTAAQAPAAREHAVSFDNSVLQSIGRDTRELVAQPLPQVDPKTPVIIPGPRHVSVRGPAQLVPGKVGQGMDISDTRNRVELSLKTGSHYNPNCVSIGFWIAPTKDGFGVTGKEAVILQETGDKVKLGLYINAAGRLQLKGSAAYPAPPKTFEQLFSEKQPEIDKMVAKLTQEKKSRLLERTELNQAELADIQATVINAIKKEAELEAGKLRFEPIEFDVLADPIANVSKWKVGEYHHIMISWNALKNLYVVNLDGRIVLRNIMDGETGGDRSSAGGAVVFGPGLDGFGAIIDELKIKDFVIDREIDPSTF